MSQYTEDMRTSNGGFVIPVVIGTVVVSSVVGILIYLFPGDGDEGVATPPTKTDDAEIIGGSDLTPEERDRLLIGEGNTVGRPDGGQSLVPADQPDYYALLGLDERASEEEIAAACRRLLEDSSGTAIALESIEEACGVLGDSGSRLLYGLGRSRTINGLRATFGLDPDADLDELLETFDRLLLQHADNPTITEALIRAFTDAVFSSGASAAELATIFDQLLDRYSDNPSLIEALIRAFTDAVFSSGASAAEFATIFDQLLDRYSDNPSLVEALIRAFTDAVFSSGASAAELATIFDQLLDRYSDNPSLVEALIRAFTDAVFSSGASAAELATIFDQLLSQYDGNPTITDALIKSFADAIFTTPNYEDVGALIDAFELLLERYLETNAAAVEAILKAFADAVFRYDPNANASDLENLFDGLVNQFSGLPSVVDGITNGYNTALQQFPDFPGFPGFPGAGIDFPGLPGPPGGDGDGGDGDGGDGDGGDGDGGGIPLVSLTASATRVSAGESFDLTVRQIAGNRVISDEVQDNSIPLTVQVSCREVTSSSLGSLQEADDALEDFFTAYTSDPASLVQRLKASHVLSSSSLKDEYDQIPDQSDPLGFYQTLGLTPGADSTAVAAPSDAVFAEVADLLDIDQIAAGETLDDFIGIDYISYLQDIFTFALPSSFELLANEVSSSYTVYTLGETISGKRSGLIRCTIDDLERYDPSSSAVEILVVGPNPFTTQRPVPGVPPVGPNPEFDLTLPTISIDTSVPRTSKGEAFDIVIRQRPPATKPLRVAFACSDGENEVEGASATDFISSTIPSEIFISPGESSREIPVQTVSLRDAVYILSDHKGGYDHGLGAALPGDAIETYYEILGVDRDASLEEIVSQYINLSRGNFSLTHVQEAFAYLSGRREIYGELYFADNYYEILGLPHSSSTEEIDNRCEGSEFVNVQLELFQKQSACDTLTDGPTKLNYDTSILPGSLQTYSNYTLLDLGADGNEIVKDYTLFGNKVGVGAEQCQGGFGSLETLSFCATPLRGDDGDFNGKSVIECLKQLGILPPCLSTSEDGLESADDSEDGLESADDSEDGLESAGVSENDLESAADVLRGHHASVKAVRDEITEICNSNAQELREEGASIVTQRANSVDIERACSVLTDPDQKESYDTRTGFYSHYSVLGVRRNDSFEKIEKAHERKLVQLGVDVNHFNTLGIQRTYRVVAPDGFPSIENFCIQLDPDASDFAAKQNACVELLSSTLIEEAFRYLIGNRTRAAYNNALDSVVSDFRNYYDLLEGKDDPLSLEDDFKTAIDSLESQANNGYYDGYTNLSCSIDEDLDQYTIREEVGGGGPAVITFVDAAVDDGGFGFNPVFEDDFVGDGINNPAATGQLSAGIAIRQSARGVSVGGILGKLAVAVGAQAIQCYVAGKILSLIPSNEVKSDDSTQKAKECSLDAAVTAVATQAIAEISADYITWALEGFHGEPLFINNPQLYWNNYLDKSIAKAIDNSNLGFLCDIKSGLKIDVSNLLQIKYRRIRTVPPRCTLRDLKNNFDNIRANPVDIVGNPISFVQEPDLVVETQAYNRNYLVYIDLKDAVKIELDPDNDEASSVGTKIPEDVISGMWTFLLEKKGC